MAKKSNNNDTQATTPGAIAKPRSSVTLLRAGLPYLVIALVLLLAAQAVVAVFLKQGAEQQRDALAAGLVAHYQATIAAFMAEREQALDGLGIAPAPLLAAIAAGDVQDAEASLKARLPGAVDVRLSPAQIDTSMPSRLSFAQQDLIARTAQSGKPMPQEIAFLNDTQVVTLARPLTGAGGVGGVLLVSFPFKPLATALKSFSPEAGKLELGQGFGPDKSAVIVASGDDVALAGPLQASATRNPNWELRFAPAESLGQTGLPLFALLGILAAGVLVVGMLFVLALRRLDASLADDVSRLDNFAEQLLRFGSREKPVLALSHFGGLVLHLDQYSAESRGGKRPQKSAADAQRDELAGISLADSDAAALLGDGGTPAGKGASRKVAGSKTKPALNLPAEIFRAYDIRGNAGTLLNADVVRVLGQAIGSAMFDKEEQTVVVGRDARLSSPDLIKALIDGLRSSGRDVVDVGTVPTPVLYFAVQHLGFGSGVMLTGSHNPAEDNGLKIVIGGHTLAGDDIQALKARAEKQEFTNGAGGYSQQNVTAAYIDQVANDVVLARPFRVVVDGGNGVAGNIGVRVLESLGCQVTPLFCEPDGSFPNHHPDPSRPENLDDLASAVAANEAQLGIAFDGDGDRLGIVTPSGKVIYTDRLMMLLAKQVLVSHPGADIVFDVKCSRDLVGVISANGGRPVMNRTGHSYLKAKLIETQAPLAGEMSGHIIFNDRWFAFDDAIYAAARVLEILSMEADDADQVFAAFPESVSTPELFIPVAEDIKMPLMMMVGKKASFKDGTVNMLDGLRVDFADGWGLVRASNTTASLVARFEGKDEAVLQRIQGQFRELLLSIEPELELPF